MKIGVKEPGDSERKRRGQYRVQQDRRLIEKHNDEFEHGDEVKEMEERDRGCDIQRQERIQTV